MIRHSTQNGQFIGIHQAPNPCGSVIYIHGLGESGLCFRGVAGSQRLSDWNHIVPDLSGYGRSIWPERGVSLEEHAERIAGIIKKIVTRPIIILGHSMGGVIGQIICETYPGLVDGFFNVEGNISLQGFELKAQLQENKESA